MKRTLIFLSLLAAASCKPSLPDFPEVGEPYAVTSGPKEHLLASYFGINSWSPDGRYLSILETDFTGRLATQRDTAIVALVDLQDNNRLIPISKTVCWNFQEAAMFHWLPSWGDGWCVFNDCREGKFVAVILNWKTGEEKIISRPVSAVDKAGEWAVSINYARLRACRPDYGYDGEGQDAQLEVAWPEGDGLWLLNLKTLEERFLLSVAQGRELMPKLGKEDGLGYFCHTIISPDAKRIFFLARTVEGFREQLDKRGYIYNWDTASMLINTDGTDFHRCFPEGWKGSHFNWRDNDVLAVTACWDGGKCWSHTIFKAGEEQNVRHIAPGIMDWDGHCIFSPDGKFLSTDGYWNKDDYRSWVLIRLEDEAILPLGRFYVPEDYHEQYSRCDLHPRWRPDGSQLGFNSVHEGSRQVYLRDVKWK